MRSCRLALSVLAVLAAGALALPTAAAAQAGGAPVESPASAAGGGAAPNGPAGRTPADSRSGPAGGARFGVKPPPDPRIRRRALARKRALAKRRAASRRRALARRRTLARRRAASPPAASPTGRFPIDGPYRILGGDGRFGSARPGHTHQGQDIVAAEGTPVVAPVSGTIAYRSYQRGGAGYYLVLHATSGRDYVFMHLRKGSIEVLPGDPVSPGRLLGEVGHTGDASGPHLHFEVWIGGWQEKGGEPIDPLPSLRAWAR